MAVSMRLGFVMVKVPGNVQSALGRTDELLVELIAEYDRCLKAKNVSVRAQELTAELCSKSRSALDRLVNVYWIASVAPNLNPDIQEKAARNVYFPIGRDKLQFLSSIGKWGPKLSALDHELTEFLEGAQPFTAVGNMWLAVANEISSMGKHVDLAPQVRRESNPMMTVRSSFGSVSFDPRAVRFSNQPNVTIRMAGAMYDASTGRIAMTPGVTQKLEVWVSFVLPTYGIDACQFARECVSGTRILVGDFCSRFL